MERFWGQMTRERMEIDLGLGRVAHIWWVRGRVRRVYIRKGRVFSIPDKEKNPRGTTVTSMVFFIAVEAQAAVPARRKFLR